MNGQLSLGETLRDEGMARAEAAAAPEWKERWRAAIRVLASTGINFTADTVRSAAGPPGDHPNAAGTLLAEARREGLIRHIGYRPSTRPELHRHPLSLWIGTAKARAV